MHVAVRSITFRPRFNCQVLADLMTIREHKGKLEGLKLCYVGDGNNMANSLIVGGLKAGMSVAIACPDTYRPDPEVLAFAEQYPGKFLCTSDILAAAKDADVLYTDIWVSMGEPDCVWAERIRLLTPYQINAKVMAMAKPDALFMHCLPSFHDTNTTIGKEIADKFGITEMEVSDEVFSGPQSVVFDEAENRMHTIKAVIYATLK